MGNCNCCEKSKKDVKQIPKEPKNDLPEMVIASQPVNVEKKKLSEEEKIECQKRVDKIIQEAVDRVSLKKPPVYY
ncbi:unnamed protein product [Gordionus sp. m RMFG-2023]